MDPGFKFNLELTYVWNGCIETKSRNLFKISSLTDPGSRDPGFLRSLADLKNKVAKVIYFIWFSNKCFEQLDYILEATVLVAKELKIGVSRRQQREGSFT